MYFWLLIQIYIIFVCVLCISIRYIWIPLHACIYLRKICLYIKCIYIPYKLFSKYIQYVCVFIYCIHNKYTQYTHIYYINNFFYFGWDWRIETPSAECSFCCSEEELKMTNFQNNRHKPLSQQSHSTQWLHPAVNAVRFYIVKAEQEMI